MSSYHSHYDEKHLIGNLLSDQDDSYLFHSSESSQSSIREATTGVVSCSNVVSAVGSEVTAAWPEPPPPYSPSSLFQPPPPGLPVSTWREAPVNVRDENSIDDWTRFLAHQTPSYTSLTQQNSTQSAPLTAPAHNENTMPFSYRDVLNRGTSQSLSNSRHGSSSSMLKGQEKNCEDAVMKDINEEVTPGTKSSKTTSSESRDRFQQITRKKGQNKVQNVNGEGKTNKTRMRTVNVPDMLEPPPIEDNSRFTILEKLPSRRNSSSFSEDEESLDSRVERTPMNWPLTKNDRKANVTNGIGITKKKWNRKDDKNTNYGIIQHILVMIGLIRLALSSAYSLSSSVLSYIYQLVVDFVINLMAIFRYGLDRAMEEMKEKIEETKRKICKWWNRKKKEKSFGLVCNIRVPDTTDETLERLLEARGQDVYSMLGVRPDECDEVIKSYYNKQSLLVHPDKHKRDGTEEAYKILSKAYQVVSTGDKRRKYDKDRIMSGSLRKEFAALYRNLQIKVEESRNRMDCNCGERHVRVPSRLPQQAARYCRICDTRHAAKNLDLWAERRFLGLFWVYYTCVNGVVYDVSSWAKCSYNQLVQLRADQHNVQYRISSKKTEKDQK